MSAKKTITHKGQTLTLYRGSQRKGGRIYPSFTLAWIAAGRRQRKTFASEEAALAAAKKIAEQLAEGTGHAHTLTPGEVADAIAALRLLRQHPGATLAGAVAEWANATKAAGDYGIAKLIEAGRSALEAQAGFSHVTVPDLVEKFLATLEREGASRRYIEDCRSRLRRVASSFRCLIHEVTSAELAAWIDRQNCSARTKKNFRTAIVTLWRFAKAEGHLPRDKQTEAELLRSRSGLNASKRQSEIGIYTPGEFARILSAAPDHLLPVFAIGGLAGLRSAELHRLLWRDIQNDNIVVRAVAAKTAQRRLVPILPPLRAILDTVKRGEPDERICARFSHENSLARAMTAAIRAAGVRPVLNGLRHSFCTYRLCLTQNAAQVALEAGNTPTILFRHYRELATVADAEAWFSIMPPHCENIIRFGELGLFRHQLFGL